MDVSSENCREFYRFLYSFHQQKYVTQADGSSLLHLSVDKNSSADDYFIDRSCKYDLDDSLANSFFSSSSLFRYPCILAIRMLIQCGADVNATNFIRNTPLHVFVTNWSSCNESVINLLCEHGAHLDSVNLLRETAIDLASPVNAIQLLRSKMQLSLKCLCARLIQTNNVSFHKKLSKSLVQFVEHH